MELLDYLILIGYCVALLAIGFRSNKKQHDVDDYYVGGRNVGTFSMAALWMSSWVGGAAIVGSAQKSSQMGISAFWYSLSIFVGFVVFALTSAAPIKKLGDQYCHLTYADLMEQRYDSRTRIVSTLTTVAAYLGYIAGQLLGAAAIISAISGIPLGWSYLLATAVTIIYTSIGGFFAVEKTDCFQSILVVAGISLVAVPMTWHEMGGLHRLATELPPEMYQWGNWGWGTIIALFASMVMTFFTSQDSFTRCYAAKNNKTARNGTLYAAFAALTISASICFLGMSSNVLFPDGSSVDGASALVNLIMHILPMGLKGLLLVAILSAVMSTADTCILCASANLTRDIYQRYVNPDVSKRNILRLGIASSVAVGVTGALVGWYFKDIMTLLIMAFTFNSAGLFIPTIAVFIWKRATPAAAFWGITLSLCVVATWYVGQAVMPENGLFAIDPVWPGLFVSACVFLSLSMVRPDALGDRNQFSPRFTLPAQDRCACQVARHDNTKKP